MIKSHLGFTPLIMEQRTGQSADPLSPAELEALQREILGPNALHYGLRRSPVFVRESARSGEERVHYIEPHWVLKLSPSF
jgi:hypothetical protein